MDNLRDKWKWAVGFISFWLVFWVAYWLGFGSGWGLQTESVSLIFETALDVLGKYDWMPNVVTAFAALWAVLIWRKQTREPMRLDAGRRAYISASKFQQRFNEIRENNTDVREQLAYLVVSGDWQWAKSKEGAALAESLRPSDGGLEFEELLAEIDGLSVECEIVGLHMAAKVLKEIWTKGNRLRRDAQRAASPNLLESTPLRPPTGWESIVYLIPRPKRVASGNTSKGEAVTTVLQSQTDSHSDEVADFKDDLRRILLPIVAGKK